MLWKIVSPVAFIGFLSLLAHDISATTVSFWYVFFDLFFAFTWFFYLLWDWNLIGDKK